MRIIVLDDEEGARRLLVRAIRKCESEAEITDFEHPQDAVNYLREHSADVAFLDIQMPGITGLEMAKHLKEINPSINIIFCTGYSEHAMEAIRLRASGYLLKPVCREDVERELAQLLYPVNPSGTGVVAQCFGNFELYKDGQAVIFRRQLAKEMLAYLVDRRGAMVTRKELAAVLFEDEEYSRKNQAYLTQIVRSLRDSLEEYGLQEMLLTAYNAYGVDTSLFTCDAYNYLDGVPEAINAFHGEYMNQYSWAEYSRGRFYK